MITISIPLFITLIVFASITALAILWGIVSLVAFIVDAIKMHKLEERNKE